MSSDRKAMAFALAREAAGARRALVRVAELRSVRTQIDTSGQEPRALSCVGVRVSLRVEGPEGVGSSEEWLGPDETPSRALVHAARAAAREARGGGSLEGALDSVPIAPTLSPITLSETWGPRNEGPMSSRRGPCLARAVALLEAVHGGRRGVDCFLDVKTEQERLVFACAGDGERLVTRERLRVSVEGELSRGGASGPVDFAAEIDSAGGWSELLGHARARGKEALARSRAHAELVPLGNPRIVLLAPDVVTWILHGPLVEGFALARAGERAPIATWLEVDDAGDEDLDEQGIVPSKVPLVRSARWLRAPFFPFDGSGRTRRDPRTGVPRATLSSLVLRATSRTEPRSELLARADLVLGEVASADPLPGGGVHVCARGSRRKGRAWRSTGLASLRIDAGQLFRKVAAASRELGPVLAQDLDVRAPWLLAGGVRVRPA